MPAQPARSDMVRAAPVGSPIARSRLRWSTSRTPASARWREAIVLTVDIDNPNNDDPADNNEESSQPLQAGAPVLPDSPTFAELGVHPDIVRALNEAGIERTFAIQELTLPLALAGEDLIGQARTGMGKTLGFGVPMLQRITPPIAGSEPRPPQALVVVPTRELCVQVTSDLAGAGKHLGIRVLSIYGGRPYEPQIAALRRGVEIVVGTPGRLLDLAEQGHLVLGAVGALVLDEADEMLDLGFLPDVERILRMVPDQRQTMLFSATMPGPIITLSRTFLNRPTHIRAEEADAGAVHERTRQVVYRAHAMDKVELLAKVLQAADRGLTMIFTRTKRTAQRVADDLADRGFAVAAVHGDLGQGAREQALRAFRSGKVDVLVATDVAARGIDVTDVTHVVNYQCPEDAKTYIHRIGRTGRAGKEGVAVTLVDWDDMPRWGLISQELGLDLAEPMETYSTSEHLFTDLNIGPKATGRLPLGQRTRAGLAAEYTDEEPSRSRGGRRAGGRDRGDRPSGGRDRGDRPSGGRDRGDRPAGERNGSGGRDSAERGQPATADTDTAQAGRRKRSRGGMVVAGEQLDAPQATGPGRPTQPGGAQADGGESARKPRRRRRRGGARRGGPGMDAAAEPDAAAS